MKSYIDQAEVKRSKQRKLKTTGIIAGVVAVFLIGGAIAAKHLSRKDSALVATPTAEATQTPELATSLLDGMQYSPDKANRHPLAVMIENHPDARPQSGLSDASIVYEAITEGGITRFMAIFGPKDVKEVGPIRSARLFFMDWLKEYDAFYAHAGGNEDALASIGTYAIKNLDNSSKYFYRDSKGRSVATEHTLYSSTDKLYQYAQSKSFDINASNFEALKFKTDGPAATDAGKGVEINFSGSATYTVKWTYDQANNKYLRYMAGSEHKDRNNDTQITAKNIVIQSIDRTLQPHGSYGSENWVFDTVGDGKAKILRDGQVIEATWKKTSLTSRTKFYDSSGAEIEFNPGNTWYEITANDVSKVTLI